MPRLLRLRSIPSAARLLAGAGALVGLLSCMEPTYFEGTPPANTTVYLEVLGADTVPDPTSLGGTSLRTRLRVGWKLSKTDFQAHPHRILLDDQPGSRSRSIALRVPLDTIVDTFTCTQRQVTARLLADLGAGYVLELARQTSRVARQ